MINSTVTYIGHSGFLVETEKLFLLFDYYQGKIPVLAQSKPVVVFVSHRHHDHFNSKIFDLALERENVTYVLSYDIQINQFISEYQKKNIDLKSKIISVNGNVSIKIPLSDENFIQITTFPSTDEGVAFLIDINGEKIYHAGDLNCWDWLENGEEYSRQMVSDYTKEMKKLEGVQIALAFVPLDPRLKETAFEGMEIFMEYAKAKTVFPIHCWGKYKIITDFLKRHEEYREQIKIITKKGQTFEL